MASVICSVHKFENVDFGILGLDSCRYDESKEEKLFDFLSDEMVKSFGYGVISVSPSGIGIGWSPSVVEKKRDRVQNIYFAHMVQVGLLKNPLVLVANSAYNGGINDLVYSLLAIHSYGMNPMMVKRDADLLACSAPLNSAAWLASGIIDLDQGDVEGARVKFLHILDFNLSDYLAMKHLSICDIKSDPAQSVKWMESSLEAAAEFGMIPGLAERVAYGMSLKACGLHREAKKQFTLAGIDLPKMTPRQWGEWGYRVVPSHLIDALCDPKLGLYFTQWAERGEDSPE